MGQNRQSSEMSNLAVKQSQFAVAVAVSNGCYLSELENRKMTSLKVEK